MPRYFRNAVGDVVDDIDARHALLFQQEHGLTLLLTEDGDQHVGAGHFALARALYVKNSTLQDTLEAQGWLGFAILVMDGDQWRGGVDELLQIMLEFVEVCAAGTQNGGGSLIIQ